MFCVSVHLSWQLLCESRDKFLSVGWGLSSRVCLHTTLENKRGSLFLHTSLAYVCVRNSGVWYRHKDKWLQINGHLTLSMLNISCCTRWFYTPPHPLVCSASVRVETSLFLATGCLKSTNYWSHV